MSKNMTGEYLQIGQEKFNTIDFMQSPTFRFAYILIFFLTTREHYDFCQSLEWEFIKPPFYNALVQVILRLPKSQLFCKYFFPFFKKAGYNGILRYVYQKQQTI